MNSGSLNVLKSHFRVKPGDIISLPKSQAEKVRKFFFVNVLIDKTIGKVLDQPVRLWRRNKTDWYRLVKTKRGCRTLLQSSFLKQLRATVEEEDWETRRKLCSGSYFAEQNRINRNLYQFKALSLSKK